MKNIHKAFSLTAAALTLAGCAATPDQFAVGVKRDVTQMVRDENFPKQQAVTQADLIAKFPNNWYNMALPYQGVLYQHNVGGVLIGECRNDINKALDQKDNVKLASAADGCLDQVAQFYTSMKLNPPAAAMQNARARVAAFRRSMVTPVAAYKGN